MTEFNQGILFQGCISLSDDCGVAACQFLQWQHSLQPFFVSHDRPGKHWLAVWIDRRTSARSWTVTRYRWRRTTVVRWNHWPYMKTNRQSLQAVTSYALMYLYQRSQEKTLSEFLSLFSRHDYVQNDHRISRWFKKELKHSPLTGRKSTKKRHFSVTVFCFI